MSEVLSISLGLRLPSVGGDELTHRERLFTSRVLGKKVVPAAGSRWFGILAVALAVG